MKKLIPVILFLSAVFTLYAGDGKEKSAPAPSGSQSGTAQPAPASPPPPLNPYYTGDGGKGMSLAILAPEAKGLAENQTYLPSLVQGNW
jgi:hypothetical protein